MNSLDLSGLWHYCPEDSVDFARADFDHSLWPTMHIPHNWFLAGLDHHGVVWFRRKFSILSEAARGRAKPKDANHFTLRFDGVDYLADVYLNGVHLGHHEGCFEPFSFAATQHVRPGNNILAVRVDSPYEQPGLDGWHMRKRLIKGVLNHHDCRPGGGWEPQGQSYNTGGIWNRVTLTEHGSITIDRVLLHPGITTAKPNTLSAHLLINNRGPRRSMTIRVRCVPDNFDASIKYEHELPTVSIPSGERPLWFTIDVPNVKRWEPWDRGFPHLYRVTITLEDPTLQPPSRTGVQLKAPTTQPSTHTTTFGFRTVHVDDQYNWAINSQRCFPRGSNYIASQWLSETLFPEVAASKHHPFPPPSGLPERSDAQRREAEGWFQRDVELMKQANLNIIRIHAHVLPPEFYDACDRAGLMVWQDFSLQWGYRDDPEFQNEAERQMTAMVHLLYNHPSIVTWCCHNESPWDAEWMANEAGGAYDPSHNRALDERLQRHVQSLDHTRHVHKNSGTGDGHTYPGWYFGVWRDYDKLPAAPFPTEYGGQGLPVRETLTHIFARFGPDAGHAELVKFKTWLDTQPDYRSYRRVPPAEKTPPELKHAREVWAAWRFHNFQPPESFQENRITLGSSLDDFIASSQAYQNQITQYSTETYRRHKYNRIHGVFQFMFTDPWPAITWSVLDYWRKPKPSFDILRRAMQPVLPLADLIPNSDHPHGKPLDLKLNVVNDWMRSFAGATCHWSVSDETGREAASGEYVLDIPMDAVSDSAAIAVPPLEPGRYRLSLSLYSAAGDILGENQYDFHTQ